MSVTALRSVRLLRSSRVWSLSLAARPMRGQSCQTRPLGAGFQRVARVGTLGATIGALALPAPGAVCAPGGGTADGWDDPTSDEAAADGDNSATDTGSGLAARLLGPVGGQITFGTVTGFCSGYALKQMGRTAAYFVGIAFIFVQGLSYLGYIKIKWSKVKDDLIRAVDSDGDGQVTANDLRTYWSKLVHMLTFQLPSTAGFVSGLALGIRYG